MLGNFKVKKHYSELTICSSDPANSIMYEFLTDGCATSLGILLFKDQHELPYFYLKTSHFLEPILSCDLVPGFCPCQYI